MTEVEMRRVAAWIDAVIRESDNTVLQDRISGDVKEMCAAFPVPSPQGLVG
jgi:glycine hydroxymethyltransferase